MAFLQKEEIDMDGVWTEPQREILRDIYTKDVQRSKTGVPVKSIMKDYRFYDIKK